MSQILTIGVAGGSGSGKTHLTGQLIQHFGDQICLVHHDDYYRAHDDLTYEERVGLNYDCPDAYDTELLIEQLQLLKQGREIHGPVYDFTQHNRSKETQLIKPKPVLVIEGILIFADPRLAELMDIRIFVDADPDVRLGRRVIRDIRERGRSVESVIRQWETTVKPMHELYVEPSKRSADLIFPSLGDNSVGVELLLDKIERHLQELSNEA